MQKPGHVSTTRGGSDYTMGRVVWLESSGDILVTNLGEVILDRKYSSFFVQVIDRGHFTAGFYAEGRVLDSLEFLNKGW